VQGVFANVAFVIIILFLLLWVFRWDQIEYALLQMPRDKSPIHPMHTSGQEDFGLSYFLIAVFIIFYTFNAWQGTAGYNCCATNAHEAKMAGVLYGWRFRVLLTITVVVPIVIVTVQKHPDFQEQAASLQQTLDSVSAPTPEQTDTLRKELLFPHALAMLLPPGLLGLMVAAALAAFISTHDAYLHSWGSIFLQDVILPFRKKPLSPRRHLWLLRLSILGVALFIFFFSTFIKPTQFIAMFFAITATVFVGGAGSAIIGGLYWKRGTTEGAWAAMITGMALSAVGIILKQIDVTVFELLADDVPWLGKPIWFVRDGLSGQEQTFIAMCSAAGMYVFVSLVGRRQVTDMDKLLYRGRYAIDDEAPASLTVAKKTWLERFGIDRNFTRGDRWVTYVSVGWPLIWSVLFVIVTIWNLFTDVPDSWWLRFWRIWLWVCTFGCAAVTIWFTIGGFFDLRYLFRHLKTHRADPTDDGRVKRGQRGDDL
jgi:SSS family solute:Na+ symporter